MRRSAHNPIRYGVLLCFVASIATIASAQQEQFREREVLDPQTGEWANIPAPPEAVPNTTLDEARRLLAEGEYRDAEKLLEDWLEDSYDDPRYFEGVFLLGEARFERNRFYQAYEQYEEVAEATAGDLFFAALRRELDVALAFLSGEPRIVWGFLRLPAYDEGVEILDRIYERVPGTRLGERALKTRADYFFFRGDMDLAQDEYANLVREYPNGRYTPFAMLRAAESASAAFPGIRFDDSALLNAEERYRQVQAAFPIYAERNQVSARLDAIRTQRAQKDLYIARWYARTEQRDAAIFYYELILSDWPETLAAQEARADLRALGVTVEESDQAGADN